MFTGTKHLFCDANIAENALATFSYNSLRDSGYGSFDFMAIDRYVKDECPYDQDLLALGRQRRPDIYALVWWPLGHQYRNPSFETLYTIREQYRIPIVAFWYYTLDEKFARNAEWLSRQVDLSVISDSIEHFENSPQLERFINLVPPFDRNVFQHPSLPRDIPISFNGAIGSYADRKDG